MPKHPQGADGKFVPKSEYWIREDGAERHLPHLLGTVDAEQQQQFERLDREARTLIIGIATFFCAWVWILFCWGFTGALTIVLAVVFYRMLFA